MRGPADARGRSPGAPAKVRTALSVFCLALGAAAATGLGFLLAIPWALPLLGALVAYPFFAVNVGRGRPRRAVLLALCWALFLSLSTVLACTWFPDRARLAVWNGPSYSQEMLEWVADGVGPEGDPSLFIPQHAFHFLAFNVACLASAGLGGLYIGAIQLNYMNFYVADLAARASHPAMAASLAWPPWAMVRVLGFVLASVPISAVLMRRARWWRGTVRTDWSYWAWGLALVTLDIALKAFLAPHWRELLLKSL